MRTTPSRLLTLLSLLQTRRDWSGELLAERLQVSTRTVRRDVGRLRELGYRITASTGPDGGYRLDPGVDLPPLLFDDEQAVALAVALQLASTAGAGVEDGALRALTTVRQVMPSRLRHRIDRMPVSSVPASGPATNVDGGVLQVLGAAVHAREILRFDHAAATPDPTTAAPPPRRVEPHHVVTHLGRWYLVAWDLDREQWRTFRADRITPRTPNGPRFARREVPGGDVGSFVAARFRGSEGTTQWPCRGSAVLGRPVGEVLPFVGDGSAERVGDRRTRVVLGSWSWTGLAAALLRLDADIGEVEPAELADALARLATRCARAASTGPHGPAA